MRVLLLLPLIAGLSFASIDTIDMGAVSTPNDWNLAGGAPDKVVAVSDDVDGNQIYSGFSSQAYTLDTSDVDLPGDATIDSVAVGFRVKGQATTSDMRPVFTLGTTDVNGTTISPTTSWATDEEVLARPGGGSWSEGDYDTLKVTIATVTENYEERNCTKLCVLAYYTAAPTPTGYVSAVTTPVGAAVWFDGTNTDSVTPCVIGSLDTGDVIVQLKLTGYRYFTDTVSVTEDDTTFVDETLPRNTFKARGPLW